MEITISTYLLIRIVWATGNGWEMFHPVVGSSEWTPCSFVAQSSPILIGEDCETKEQCVHSLEPTTSVVEEQSRDIRNTPDMVERVPTDGRSSFSDISIEGFPPLYVGEI